MPTMKSFRHLTVTSLVAAALAGGCGSGGSAPPTVYITSTLGSSTAAGQAGKCNINSPDNPFFTIGSPGSPVPTGGTYIGSTVSVTCSVVADGNAFDVNMEVNFGQLDGITIGGKLTNTTGPQGGIESAFNAVNTGNYIESDCTVTLAQGTPGNPPIAAGRIEGTVTCPTIANAGANAVCASSATFIFENCDQ